MKKLKKAVSILVAIAMIVVLLSGCGSEAPPSGTSGNPAANAGNTKWDGTYPIVKDGSVTLTYWVEFSSKLIKSLDESPMYKKMEQDTGVKIKFINPSTGGDTQALQTAFNLLVASNDLPDILDTPPSYPGGADKAISDGIYYDFTDIFEQYAPNFNKIIEKTPDIKRECVSANGRLWKMPQTSLEKAGPWAGPFIRKDLLDKAGLSVPETIDEWETALKAMKSQGIKAPLTLTFTWLYESTSAFVGAYDASLGWSKFMNKDGKIVYGPIEPGFKEYLTTMNRWYQEGLLDKDFITSTDEIQETAITSGKAGSYVGGYGCKTYNNIASKNIPGFNIVPAPYPKLTKDQTVNIRETNFYTTGNCGVISATCKNPEIALAWLDYSYGADGFLLHNYGIEGESYEFSDETSDADKYAQRSFPDELKDKGVKFTDTITNNKDGYSREDFNTYYLTWNAPCHRGNIILESDIPAVEIWEKTSDKWALPKGLSFDADTTKKNNEIITQVDTYQKEMMFKMIRGDEPISRFDDYVAQINKLGMDTVLKNYQSAYDKSMSIK